MNWYFEIGGVSKGPYPEADFAQMTRRGEIPPDSLIWRPGMPGWTAIRDVNPEWAFVTAAAGPSSKGGRTLSPSRTPSPAPEAPGEDDLPVIEAAIPVEAPAPARHPVPSKLKLQAPTPAQEKPEDPQKSGLLKRVFGFGGKKKS